jgi:hypothetical protein
MEDSLEFESILSDLSTDDAAILFLERLYRKTESRPISWAQRAQMETFMKNLFLKFPFLGDKSDAVRHINQRLSFTYIPPVSSAVIWESAPSNLPSTSLAPPQFDASVRSDDSAILPNPFKRISGDHAMKCTIHRIRSSMRFCYRLYVNFDDEQLQPGCKFNESNFLMGSRKVSSGLSFQYLLWSVSDMKEWKEKSSFAKVTKNNTVLFAKLNDPSSFESFDGSGKVAVAVKSVDKLIHVTAILTSGADTVSDSVLTATIEVRDIDCSCFNCVHCDLYSLLEFHRGLLS